MRAAPPAATTTGTPLSASCSSTGSDCTVDATAAAMAHLTKVYIAGLLILGLFGNVYCVTAFLMPVFRRVPSTLYLAALALSDIGFLLTLGLMWMRSIGLRFLDMPQICASCMFVSYFCCFVSSWLVFAITMERYLLASGDRRTQRCCASSWFRREERTARHHAAKPVIANSPKHRRVRVTFLAIIIFGLLVNSWVLFTAGSVPRPVPIIGDDSGGNSTISTPALGPAVCDVDEAAAGRWYPVFNALDMIFSFTLPFLGVLVLNAKIGFRVCKAQSLARQRDETRTGTSSTVNIAYEDTVVLRRDSRLVNLAFIQNYVNGDPASTETVLDRALDDAEFLAQLDAGHRPWGLRRASGARRSRRGRRDKIERRVTQLLVTVSLAYLVLNLPSYVHRVVFAFENSADAVVSYKTPLGVVAETISYLMFYTQFSINFFLYSCHGCMFGFNC